MRDQARVERQMAAIWKWRWLGWRDSTPAFKGSLALLVGAGVGLALKAAGLL